MYECMLQQSTIILSADFSWSAPSHVKKVLFVTNSTMQTLYPDAAESFFPHAEKIITFLLPDSEKAKRFIWLEKILTTLMKERFNRDDYIAGFGGGVITDISGLAASLYLRGMQCILLPTTLLAQVDAAVGGKTGINFRNMKNAVGTFYFPEFVVMSTAFFTTLSEREYNNGLIELIKYGFVRDYSIAEEMYASVDALRRRDPTLLFGLVRKAVDIKCGIVTDDEHDSGERHILNFGHTYGHALETATRFSVFKHGEAVGVGILKAFDIAHALGYNVRGFRKDFEYFLKTLGCPVEVSEDTERKVWKYMSYDKKIRNNKIRYIIPSGAGVVFVKEFVSYKEIKELIYN